MKETRNESANADGQSKVQYEALRVLGNVCDQVTSPRMRATAVLVSRRLSVARFAGLESLKPSNPALRYAFGFASYWALICPSVLRTRFLVSSIAITNATLINKLIFICLTFFLCSCGPTTNNNEPTNQPIKTITPAKLSAPLPTSLNRTTKSQHFQAHYSSQTMQKEVKAVLETLEDAHANYSRKLSSFGINLNAISSIEILIHDSTGDFTSSTGQTWWSGAATKDNRIEIQPFETLRKRGILETTLRHELAHIFIHAVNRKPVPRWLDEGIAIHLSGEGKMLLKVKPVPALLSVDEIEKRLASPSSYEDMRQLYAAAYRKVLSIVGNEGEAAVWKQIGAI